MSARVDHDLIADYVGGALDGTPDFARVEQLIATDPGWRQAFEQLTIALRATAADLGRLRDVPEPMPADVAERITAALTPAPTPVRSRVFIHKLRWAVPLAVAAAAIGFLWLKVPLTNPATGMHDGAAAQKAVAPEMATDAAGQPVPVITSGRHYDRSTVATGSADVPRAAASSPPKADSLAGKEPVAGLERLSNPAALNACLHEVALVLPGTPTLVDMAIFENMPAVVISITATSGKWTFVAGPQCGLAGPDEIYRAPLP